MTHMEHIGEMAALNEVMGDHSRWSSWSSPVGLIIFFNGIAVCFLIVRFALSIK